MRLVRDHYALMSGPTPTRTGNNGFGDRRFTIETIGPSENRVNDLVVHATGIWAINQKPGIEPDFLFLTLLMHRSFLAVSAEFLEFYLIFHRLSVARRKIVDALAVLADKSY